MKNRFDMTYARGLRRLGLVATCAAVLSSCTADHAPQEANDEPTEAIRQAGSRPPRRTFATSTTDIYQNNDDGEPWQTNSTTHWRTINAFRSKAKKFSAEAWVYPLEGAWWMLAGSDTGDGGADTVDFLLVLTHGAAGFYKSVPDLRVVDDDGREAAILSMEYDKESVYSTYMRLGDNGRQLSVLAVKSCNTLRLDGKQVARWSNAFRGGLRMLLSHHGTHYSGNISAAGRLANRFATESLAHAWYYGEYDTDHRHSPVAMTTGSSREECHSRLQHMTWNNMDSFRRIRDDENKWHCWRRRKE